VVLRASLGSRSDQAQERDERSQQQGQSRLSEWVVEQNMNAIAWAPAQAIEGRMGRVCDAAGSDLCGCRSDRISLMRGINLAFLRAAFGQWAAAGAIGHPA
jgi:hypothetical protein